MCAHFVKVQFGFDLRRLWNGQNPLSRSDLCSKFWANQNIVSVPTKMEKSERAKDGGSRRAERSIWGQGGREGREGIEEDRWVRRGGQGHIIVRFGRLTILRNYRGLSEEKLAWVGYRKLRGQLVKAS